VKAGIICARRCLARFRYQVRDRRTEDPAAIAPVMKQQVGVPANCESQRVAISVRQRRARHDERGRIIGEMSQVQRIDVEAVLAVVEHRDPGPSG
jgi:hypothetical protein